MDKEFIKKLIEEAEESLTGCSSFDEIDDSNDDIVGLVNSEYDRGLRDGRIELARKILTELGIIWEKPKDY